MNFLIVFLILISFIAFKIYQKTRVPEGLKNIPTLPFSKWITAMVSGEAPDKTWKDIREILEKEGIAKVWFGGRWSILVTDLELVKDAATKTDLYPKVSILDFPKSLFFKHFGTNVVFANGEVWKRHRRVANPAFRNLPLHTFNEAAVKLLKVMEKIDYEPIEAKSLMRGLTLDVLGKVSFGFDFNNLEDPNNIYATTYHEAMIEISNVLYIAFPFLNYLPRTEAYKKLAKLNGLYDEIIENKRKSMETGELENKINNNTADLLDYMIQATNDPENPTLSNDELRYNVALFMLAGHDTTANALSTILYLLAAHKDVQQKVRDEMFRILGDNLTPNMEQHKELKYMNMIINENLRLYPPVSLLQERRPLQNIKFRNYVIPANTGVLLYVYGINHSSKNWKNPENFNPERFENEKYDHYAMLSFGGGNRICLGNNFSLIEQRVMLCALLRKYEVSLPANSIHKDKLQIGRTNSGTVGPSPNLYLRFKRRTE